MFAGKGAIKGAKTAIKTVAKQGVKGALKTGARAAKGAAVSAVKNTAKAVVELGGVAKQGAKAALKNGKLAIPGIKNGFGKGAKSFGALAKNIASKMKLKKVKITRTKRWFQIMGLFNPWVLLASGEIKHVDRDTLNAKGIKKAKVGDKFLLDGEEAIMVGSHSSKGAKTAKEAIESGGTSKYVDELVEMSDDVEGLKTRFKELNEAEDAKKLIEGSTDPAWLKDPNISDAAKDAAKKRGNLRKELATAPGEEAHHAVTVGMIGESKVVQDAIDSGFDFNSKVNGINLKKYSKSLGLDDGIHASHPFYDDEVLGILKKFETSFSVKLGYTQAHAKQFTEILSSKLIQNLDAICKSKGVKVDDLFIKGLGGLDADSLYREILVSLKHSLPK